MCAAGGEVHRGQAQTHTHTNTQTAGPAAFSHERAEQRAGGEQTHTQSHRQQVLQRSPGNALVVQVAGCAKQGELETVETFSKTSLFDDGSS